MLGTLPAELVYRVSDFLPTSSLATLRLVNHQYSDFFSQLYYTDTQTYKPESEVDAPLHWAVSHNNSDFARFLLSHGASVSASVPSACWCFNFPYRPTALHMCRTSTGGKELARLLLENGADVNAGADDEFLTPLHIAASRGDSGMVLLLLENGADPNALSMWKTWRPIDAAIFTSRWNCVFLLGKRGAKGRAIGRRGPMPWKYTVLYMAMMGCGKAVGRCAGYLKGKAADGCDEGKNGKERE